MKREKKERTPGIPIAGEGVGFCRGPGFGPLEYDVYVNSYTFLNR